MTAPSEITVRAATPEDLDNLVRVNHEVWHATYDGLYPEAFAAEQTPEKIRKAWERNLADRNPSKGWFVAESGGKLVHGSGLDSEQPAGLGDAGVAHLLVELRADEVVVEPQRGVALLRPHW